MALPRRLGVGMIHAEPFSLCTARWLYPPGEPTRGNLSAWIMRTRGPRGTNRRSPRIAVHSPGTAKTEEAKGPSGVMHAVHVPTATTATLQYLSQRVGSP